MTNKDVKHSLAVRVMSTSRSRDRSGRIMYFPTRSASLIVLARTRLWTLNPVCRQERIRSALGHQEMQMGVGIKAQSVRDVEAGRLPPWRENGLKKRAVVMALAVSVRYT